MMRPYPLQLHLHSNVVTLLLILTVSTGCGRDLITPAELGITRKTTRDAHGLGRYAVEITFERVQDQSCALARLEARANNDIRKADLRRRDLEDAGINYNDTLNWVSFGFLGVGVGAGIAAAVSASKALIGSLGTVGPTGLFATEVNRRKSTLGDQLPAVYGKFTDAIAELTTANWDAHEKFYRNPADPAPITEFQGKIVAQEKNIVDAEKGLFALMVNNPGLHFGSRVSAFEEQPKEPPVIDCPRPRTGALEPVPTPPSPQ